MFGPLGIAQESVCLGEDYLGTDASCILDAKYEQDNIINVAFGQQ